MKPTILFLAICLSAIAADRFVIVVPTSVQSAANQAALAFDPAGGTNTFTVPLVTLPDTNTVTHYWAAFRPTGTNAAAISALATTPPFAGAVMVGQYSGDDVEAPFRMLETNGLAVYAPPMN